MDLSTLNAEELAEHWSQLDEQVLETEARLRVKLHQRREPPPEISPSVEAIMRHYPLFQDEVQPLLQLLVDRYPINLSSLSIEAKVLDITLKFAEDAIWLVSIAALRWPGCRVRLYTPKPNDVTQIDAKTYHIAEALIQATVTAMSRR